MEIQLIHVLVTILGVVLSAIMAGIWASLSSLNAKMLLVVQELGSHAARITSLEKKRR